MDGVGSRVGYRVTDGLVKTAERNRRRLAYYRDIGLRNRV
jgi:hypothetical protein